MWWSLKNTLDRCAEHLLEEVCHQSLVLLAIEVALHVVELHDGRIVFAVEPWTALSWLTEIVLGTIFWVEKL